mmetsp:Transcript_38663/g.83673  ORF Transcript_38663/g.83673 Transcript_38663/m.83673 type:complete len:283 (+) Transcript_38663:151-999(+)
MSEARCSGRGRACPAAPGVGQFSGTPLAACIGAKPRSLCRGSSAVRRIAGHLRTPSSGGLQRGGDQAAVQADCGSADAWENGELRAAGRSLRRTQASQRATKLGLEGPGRGRLSLLARTTLGPSLRLLEARHRRPRRHQRGRARRHEPGPHPRELAPIRPVGGLGGRGLIDGLRREAHCDWAQEHRRGGLGSIGSRIVCWKFGPHGCRRRGDPCSHSSNLEADSSLARAGGRPRGGGPEHSHQRRSQSRNGCQGARSALRHRLAHHPVAANASLWIPGFVAG